MVVSPCGECGASCRWGSCAELFDILLALDHQRRQPWGEYHAVSVPCHLLQHPSTSRGADKRHLLGMLQEFRQNGLAAVHRQVEARVRLNRQGRLSRGTSSELRQIRRPTYTIEDFSVDGTFPPHQFEERVDLWVESTISMFE